MRSGIPQVIELERLMLRRLYPEHASLAFYTYASKPQVTKYLLWQAHADIEETFQFLRQCDLGWQAGQVFNYGIWLKPMGRLIGSIGIHRNVHEGSFFLGYALSPSAWGRGYATEATQGLVHHARHALGNMPLRSFVHPDHHASARVLEKAGFIPDKLQNQAFIFPQLGPDPVLVHCFYFHGHRDSCISGSDS